MLFSNECLVVQMRANFEFHSTCGTDLNQDHYSPIRCVHFMLSERRRRLGFCSHETSKGGGRDNYCFYKEVVAFYSLAS